MIFSRTHTAIIAATLASCITSAMASEADIRKALSAAYPQMPAIQSVSTTPIPGVFEVNLGSEIIYSDAKGGYILQGTLINTATKASITQARLNEINKVDFKTLPLADAVVTKIGDGSRKMAVFADPNCTFCKKLERESVPQLKNVTIYTLLVPILSPDSATKSKSIWCSPNQHTAWENWIQKDISPAPAPASCDTTAIDRNTAFAKKIGVTGTPTIIFENGFRAPGAIPAEEIEKLLAAK